MIEMGVNCPKGQIPNKIKNFAPIFTNLKVSSKPSIKFCFGLWAISARSFLH